MQAGDIVREALRLGFEEAVAVVKTTRWGMLRDANNEATVFNKWVDASTRLYLVKGRRVYTASLEGTFNPGDVLRNSLKAIGLLPEDKDYVELVHEAKPQVWDSYDPAVGGLDEKAPDLVKEAIDASLGEGAVRNAGQLTYGIVEAQYSDSTGLEASWRLSFVNLVNRAFGKDPEVSSMWGQASRQVSGIRARELGSLTGSLVKLSSSLPKVEFEGRARVLLSPLVAGHLYGLVASMWLNAYSAYVGLSGFDRSMIGKQVASGELTIMDLSSSRDAVGSEPIDLEGNPTSDVVLIENGVLREFLTNNRTAAKLGLRRTGNAVNGWVTPSPRHIGIRAGAHRGDLQGLLKDLGDGVFIQNNWYTRFQNVKEGLFSTVCRDTVLLVKNGEPAGLVRGVRISDRFSTLLNKVAGLSSEAYQVYWWDMPTPATSPYVILDGVNLTRAI